MQKEHSQAAETFINNFVYNLILNYYNSNRSGIDLLMENSEFRSEIQAFQNQQDKKLKPTIIGKTPIVQLSHAVPQTKKPKQEIKQIKPIQKPIARPIPVQIPIKQPTPIMQPANEVRKYDLEFQKGDRIYLLQGLDKVTTILSDPSILSVEAPGPEKPLIVNKMGTLQTTNIFLTTDEINLVMQQISERTRIPIVSGVFKALFDSYMVSSIISDVVGTRFIIEKRPVLI